MRSILGHAAAQPDHIAVVHGEQHLSYSDLLALARAVAKQLETQGVQRGERVGLHLERTPLALAAVLGIMMHGASYVRSEEHTSELQSLMRISYAVFCLKKTH